MWKTELRVELDPGIAQLLEAIGRVCGHVDVGETVQMLVLADATWRLRAVRSAATGLEPGCAGLAVGPGDAGAVECQVPSCGCHQDGG